MEEVDITAFMPLITKSSEAKNSCFEALQFAKVQDAEGFKKQIGEARELLIQAHRKQTELLSINTRSEETPITIYLIHAMDHVSNAQMVYDLVRELAEIHLKEEGI